MRAVVLLCLLHAAFAVEYSWNGPVQTTLQADPRVASACLTDQASCGCCLIQKQIKNLEQYFEKTTEELNKELTKSKTALSNIRASRSFFSVSLNNDTRMSCAGPYPKDMFIMYKYIFFNLGNGYNVQTGIFTPPRSGVYSLTVTIYAFTTSVKNVATCANLQVNGQVVATLFEQNGQDTEDSATVVVSLKLKAGDQVAVNLLKGCFVCDNRGHHNTFTGFLLYATD